jgi:RHS repeat-associated protein
LRYIDDLVLREKGSERLYPLADPNWNVVAICNISGNIQERYTYDAFGKRNVFNENFTAKAGTTFDWNRAFTGQVLDIETGIMLYRSRYYHIQLGRFVSRDPIEYEASDNSLYRYVRNRIMSFIDPTGLLQVCCRPMQTGNILDKFIDHCQLRNKCVDGETSSDVQVDGSSSRQLASCPPKKCSEATVEDIEKCLRDNKHSDTPYNSKPDVGNNCQVGAAIRLGKCCLISDWKPGFVAGESPGKGKCFQYAWRLGMNGDQYTTVRTCVKWEYEWQTRKLPKQPDSRTPVLPPIDDSSHAGWSELPPPGIKYPVCDNFIPTGTR